MPSINRINSPFSPEHSRSNTARDMQNFAEFPPQSNQNEERVRRGSNNTPALRLPERMPATVRANLNSASDMDFERMLAQRPIQRGRRSIENLISGGVNALDASGRTLAEVVLQSGRPDAPVIMSALRAEGADLLSPDQDGNQLLHRMVMAGNLPAVQILLLHGIDPNETNTRTLPTITRYAATPEVHAAMNIVNWNWNEGDQASALHLAAAFGNDPAFIRALIAAGADIHLANTNGAMPLHWAAVFSSNPAIVDALMENGANISISTAGIGTPLHGAAIHNSPEMIDTLIKHGADIEAETSSGITPLAWASQEPGQSDAVRTLIHHGACIGRTSTQNIAPLDEAVNASMLLEIGNTLRENGIDIEREGFGRFIIHHIDAGYFASPEVICALIDGGAHLRSRAPNEPSPEDVALAVVANGGRKYLPNASPEARNLISRWHRSASTTSLTLAALKHQPQASSETLYEQILFTWLSCRPGTSFAKLMANRGGVNARDSNGKTLVEVALESNQGHRGEITAALKAEGADLALIDENNSHLLNRLIIARNLSGARILLSNQVDSNAINQCSQQLISSYARAQRETESTPPLNWNWDGGDGATPLHLASAFGNDPALISELIAAGARVNLPNENQATPLHWAAVFAKDPRIIDALVSNGANISARSPNLGTPLHCAAGNNANADIPRRLIAHGADIHNSSSIGNTPLHYACFNPAQANVVRALLENGAHTNSLNNEQMTPLLVATESSLCTEAARILMNEGMDLQALRCEHPARRYVEAGYSDLAEIIRALNANVGRRTTVDRDYTNAIRSLQNGTRLDANSLLGISDPAANEVLREALTLRTSTTLAALEGRQDVPRASTQLQRPRISQANSGAIDVEFATGLRIHDDDVIRNASEGRSGRIGNAHPVRTPSSVAAATINQQRELADLPLLLANPLVREVTRWYRYTDRSAQAARASVWHTISTEPHADEFQDFIAHLNETAEYRHAPQRPDYVRRGARLLTAIENNPELRQRCFLLVEDATTSCGDRIALSLNNLDMARIEHEAEYGQLSAQDLINIRTSQFRIQILGEVAQRKIAALRPTLGNRLDEIEVIYGAVTLVAEELNLIGVSRTMLYGSYAHFSADDKRNALALIAQREGRGEYVKFIAEWQPWQKQLRRMRPHDFADLDQHVASERENLAEQPAYTSDNDYLELCRRMENMQRERLTFSLENWTREWLVQNRRNTQAAI